MEIKKYRPNPEFVGVINQVASFIRVSAAEIAGRELGYSVDPNTLPKVRFVDNWRTRIDLPKLQPWTTALVVGTKLTPLGGRSIEEVLIHPDSIARRVLDVMDHFGGEEKTLEIYQKHHRVSEQKAKISLLEHCACSLIVEETLRVLPEIDPYSRVAKEVIDLALDRWDPKSR